MFSNWGTFVAGRPKPQGSVRAFAAKGRAYVAANHSDAFVVWRNTVVEKVEREWPHGRLDNARVFLRFTFNRPKSQPKWYRNDPASAFHVKRPDIDKLARAILDALVAAGVLADDSVVSDLHVIKEYTNPAHETEGVFIGIDSLPLPTKET